MGCRPVDKACGVPIWYAFGLESTPSSGIGDGIIDLADQDHGACQRGVQPDHIGQEHQVIKTQDGGSSAPVNIPNPITNFAPEAEFFAGW